MPPDGGRKFPFSQAKSRRAAIRADFTSQARMGQSRYGQASVRCHQEGVLSTQRLLSGSRLAQLVSSQPVSTHLTSPELVKVCVFFLYKPLKLSALIVIKWP